LICVSSANSYKKGYVMKQESELTKETNTRQKFLRPLFFVAGTVSLALGTIFIVLPLLPTTPFLLLALACYCRSSKRMIKWVLNNKYFDISDNNTGLSSGL